MRRGQHPSVAKYYTSAMEYTVLVERYEPRPRTGVAGHAAHDSGVFGPGGTRNRAVRIVDERAPLQSVGIEVFVEFQIGTHAANFRFAFDQNPVVLARVEQ